MRIEAAGKTWIVEERELPGGFGSGRDRFYGFTFRNAASAREELHVRWARRPERLTPRVARELFEIAGVRSWEDPRDSRPYRLRLETAAGPPGVPRPVPVEVVRFERNGGGVQAAWTLGKPLGCASDSELMELLDRALELDGAPEEDGRGALAGH